MELSNLRQKSPGRHLRDQTNLDGTPRSHYDPDDYQALGKNMKFQRSVPNRL